MDYNSFSDLQRRYPRTLGNDYTLPADLRQRFEAGVMTASADDQALFLFERRVGFTKLHFRLLDTAAELVRTDGETLAAFLTYRLSRYPEIAAAWLLGQGFCKTNTLRRHTASAITGDLSTEGVSRATPDEAYTMLGRYFSPVEADMPCRELYEGALCIRVEGTPVAMLYMGQTLIIAVAPEVRGQGLGKKLYRAYAAFKASEGKKSVFHEWVRPDNAASLAMFASLGFTADDVYTECYVRD